MTDPVKWRYGARLRGQWIVPRGCWEYDLETAKAAALRTWPYASKVMVVAEGDQARGRWMHETGKGWRFDAPPAEAPRRSTAPANAWWLDRD